MLLENKLDERASLEAMSMLIMYLLKMQRTNDYTQHDSVY